MSYRKSKARIDFEKNLKELKQLSVRASYKSSGFSYKHKNLVYQSSVFLLCASIEEYFKSFFEDLFFQYKQRNLKLNCLPDNLRAFVVLHSSKNNFKSYVFNGDERKITKKIIQSSGLYQIFNDNDIFNNHINAATLLATNRYPSVKNIKIIYYRFGIDEIFSELNRRARKDIKVQLESFLSVREAISHQSPPTLTITDVKRHFLNVHELINYLDRIKFTAVCLSSGEYVWPS